MQVVITVDAGQIQITSDLPGDQPEKVVLILAQALELARVPAVARQISMMPKPVEIVSPANGGANVRALGIRGGEATFRRGTA